MVQRSNPQGMLIRFDVTAPDAVNRMELDLEGDDEPAISISFGVGIGFDGRYIRALSFKPVRNGTYPLVVRAWTTTGLHSSTVCKPGVEVTF